MLKQVLAEIFRDVVKHHKDVMITFAVRTDSGQEKYQSPILKPLDVFQNKEGDYLLRGYNLRRLPDSSADVVSSRDIIRSYRIDRIIPHTLQFLYPAVPPDLLASLPQDEDPSTNTPPSPSDPPKNN